MTFADLTLTPETRLGLSVRWYSTFRVYLVVTGAPHEALVHLPQRCVASEHLRQLPRQELGVIDVREPEQGT